MNYKELYIYQLSRDLSKKAWDIYKHLPQEFKFKIGMQLLTSADSVGANIAEGHNRYYYLDSVRFYYNARASLFEALHWIELLNEREFIEDSLSTSLDELINNLGKKINNFINVTKKQSNKSS